MTTAERQEHFTIALKAVRTACNQLQFAESHMGAFVTAPEVEAIGDEEAIEYSDIVNKISDCQKEIDRITILLADALSME